MGDSSSKHGSIADAVSLLDVVLADASLTRGTASDYEPGAAKVSIESEGRLPEGEVGEETRILLTRDTYSIELSNSSEEIIAKIDATFVAVFNLAKDFDASLSDIEEFSNSTGRLVLRPYFREFIHQSCMKMGIPAYILEVLQFRGSVTGDGEARVTSHSSTFGV